jgi:hypothetical protein
LRRPHDSGGAIGGVTLADDPMPDSSVSLPR